jgi:hypothetical protein
MTAPLVNTLSPMSRPLTDGEWRGLDPGLVAALEAAGACPVIVPLAHAAAKLSALWRGSTPILARGDALYWPGAPADLSTSGRPFDLAILQHELQHVLDYRVGRLTAARYLTDPREWTYSVEPTTATKFDRLGAEQRATLAERLWLAQHGLRAASEIAVLRAVIPWAAQTGLRAVAAQGAA